MKEKFSKKQYTVEQVKAIDGLLLMLDELENKPRRLFYELENLATVFEKTEAIPSLREAQDLMYSHINEGAQFSELFTSLRQYTMDEWRNQIRHSPDDKKGSSVRIEGAEEYVKKHITRLTERRF